MAKQIAGQDGMSEPIFQVDVSIGGLTPKPQELVDLLNQLLEDPAPAGSPLDRLQQLVQEFN